MTPRRKPLPPIDALGASTRAAFLAAFERHVTEDMSPDDQDALGDRILDAGAEALRTSLMEAGPDIADELDAALPNVLKQRARRRRGFERRLRDVWGPPLDRFEGTLQAFLEFGEAYFQEIHRPDTQPMTSLPWALAQLHARACRVSLEILTLLQAGLADGAHARWRTLHELAVVALVLQDGGEAMAERYLAHRHVGNWKVATELQQHAHLLGWESVPDHEMATLQTRLDELVDRYGSHFAGDYGWASGANGAKRPTLGDLEASMQISRWRPIVKWANDAIHSSPRGFSGLSAIHGLGDGVIAAGTSNGGLADPSQHSVLSLEFIVVAMAVDRPTGDRCAALVGFRELVIRTQRAFLDAEAAFRERAQGDAR